MSYTKRIVCLANSLKTGGLCIAGREITPWGYAGWIRPVSIRPHEELTYLEYRYDDGSGPKLLDIVEIGLLRPSPDGFQSENHLIDPKQRWVKRGRVSFSELAQLKERPACLWTNSDHTSTGAFNCVSREEAARHTTSLHLIQTAKLDVWLCPGKHGERAVYGAFQSGEHEYKFSVTDPLMRERYGAMPLGRHHFAEGRGAYLCVSLTKPFGAHEQCHKLIASVLTDPVP